MAIASKRSIRLLTQLRHDVTSTFKPQSIRLFVPPLDLAQRLLREADIELFAGHHAAAERLAHRAAELRGWSA